MGRSLPLNYFRIKAVQGGKKDTCIGGYPAMDEEATVVEDAER